MEEEDEYPVSGRIDVYTANGCGFCNEQKKILREVEAKYPEVEVVVHDVDEDGIPEVKGKPIEGVPFLVFSCGDGRPPVGFIDQMAEFDDIDRMIKFGNGFLDAILPLFPRFLQKVKIKGTPVPAVHDNGVGLNGHRGYAFKGEGFVQGCPLKRKPAPR